MDSPLRLRLPGQPDRSVPGQPGWKDYGRPNIKDMARAQRLDRLAGGASLEEARAIRDEALGLSADKPRRRVATPVDEVLLDRSRLDHIVENRTAARERYANRILPTLEDPEEVWLTLYDNGEYRMRYLKLYDDDRNGLSIVTETPDGALLYNFIPGPHRSIDRQRLGVLLYPKSP